MQSARVKSFIVDDEWRIDPNLNRISRNGATVDVSPRAMDLLVYMSTHVGDVVSIEDIINNIRGGVIVSDGSIYNCIYELRQAFNDDPLKPAFIETIAKRGYRLIPPVEFVISDDEVTASSEVPVPTIDAKPTFSQKGPGLLALAGVVVLGLAFAVFQFGQQGTKTTPDQNSIAVLPFLNLSDNANSEYFADGLTEELINGLQKLQNLKVAGRSSSFFFKGKSEALGVIGERLGVAHVLEGSVRRSEDQLRITTQLVRTEDGFLIWSETFDRDLDDIFAIQDEISHAVVNALQLTLSLDDETKVAAATSNMEAYDTYLKGKFEFARRGENSRAILDAVRLFEEATGLDPAMANAYAGLGRTRALLINFAIAIDPADRRTQMILAREATNRALALDADNVEAILSSAIIKYQFETDFAGARIDFQRAVSLSPNNSEIYNYYGDFLGVMMDFDQAIVMERRAAELDPLSVINEVEYGKALVFAGRVDEGLGILENLVTEMPDELFATTELARMYFYSGRIEEAINLSEKSLMRWPSNQLHKTVLSMSQAVAGDREALQELIDNNFKTLRAVEIATVFFEYGELDRAAAWLDQAHREGIDYFQLNYLSIADPRRHVDHAGLNEILSRPGLKELIEIRRRNLGLE